MNQTDPIAPGHVYGCHSDHTGDEPRGGETAMFAPSGYYTECTERGAILRHQKVVPIRTQWLPMACGHSLRITDPSCTGCANREREE